MLSHLPAQSHVEKTAKVFEALFEGLTPRASQNPSVPHRPNLGGQPVPRRVEIMPQQKHHAQEEGFYKLSSGAGSTTSASSSVSYDKMSLATTRTDTGTCSNPSSCSPTPRSTRAQCSGPARAPHASVNRDVCEEETAGEVSPQMIAGLQTTSRSQSPELEDDCHDIPLAMTPRELQPFLAGHTDLQRQHPPTPQHHVYEGNRARQQDVVPHYISQPAVPASNAGLPLKIHSFARPSSSPVHHSPLGIYNYQARTSSAVRSAEFAAPALYGYSRQPWHAC